MKAKTSDGSTTNAIDKSGMENAIIPENQSKLHQHERFCPFLNKPLVIDFEYHGEKNRYNEFVNNNYVVPENVDETKKCTSIFANQRVILVKIISSQEHH